MACGYNPAENNGLLHHEQEARALKLKEQEGKKMVIATKVEEKPESERQQFFDDLKKVSAILPEKPVITVVKHVSQIDRLRADKAQFLKEVAELGPQGALRKRGIKGNSWGYIARFLGIERPSKKKQKANVPLPPRADRPRSEWAEDAPTPAPSTNPCLHCEALADNVRLRDGLKRLQEIIGQATKDLARAG